MGNPTNGTTEWVRTLEERMSARPIHLFTLIIGENKRPKHYKVDVLSAAEGDVWINEMDAATTKHDNQVERLRIREQFEIAALGEALTVMKEPTEPGAAKPDTEAMYELRLKIQDRREAEELSRAEAQNKLQTAYQVMVKDAMFRYSDSLAEDREEIEDGGLTHEQVIQAVLRLVFATDPIKVHATLAQEIQTAHSLTR